MRAARWRRTPPGGRGSNTEGAPMAVAFEIDPVRRRLRTLATGVVTYDELRRHLDDEEHDGALGLTEVIDARGAATDLTSDEVRALVARTDALARRGHFGALA